MLVQGKNAGNPDGLSSILTQQKHKLTFENRGSDNFCHPKFTFFLYYETNKNVDNVDNFVHNLLFGLFCVHKKCIYRQNMNKNIKKVYIISYGISFLLDIFLKEVYN